MNNHLAQHIFVIDIDGTILHNNQAINDSVEFIQTLQKNDCDFLLATNSIQTKKSQVSRLANVGIKVSLDNLYSPIDSINIYLENQSFNNCYCVASQSDIDQIQCTQNTQDPEIIVLIDFEKNDVSYSQLQKIIDLVQKGIPIITASRSPFYLAGDCKKIDTGAFVNLIESITQTKIDVFGKPSKFYFDNALKKLGAENLNKQAIMIGDDFETDINSSKELGFNTVLMQSGKYKLGQETLCQPDLLLKSLLDIEI